MDFKNRIHIIMHLGYRHSIGTCSYNQFEEHIYVSHSQYLPHELFGVSNNSFFLVDIRKKKDVTSKNSNFCSPLQDYTSRVRRPTFNFQNQNSSIIKQFKFLTSVRIGLAESASIFIFKYYLYLGRRISFNSNSSLT